MQPRYQVSRAAIGLIKAFEGYRRQAARLADGRWTIGYGHTQTAREGAEVSEKDAEALLTYDLIAVAHAVNDQTYTPLTQNQFDALCAFAFSIGLPKFRISSVLRLVNQGQMLQAAGAMELWRTADFQGERMVIDALVRRRAAEKTLFLTPLGGWVPAPSPILPPNLDMDLAGGPSRATPAVVTVSMDGPEALAEREPAVFSDGLTATQRVAAAVTSRLQKIFPDDAPEGEAPAPPVDSEQARSLASAREREPLPPPAWPMAFGGPDKPSLVRPPADQDLQPEIQPEAAPDVTREPEPEIAHEPEPPPVPEPEPDPIVEMPVMQLAATEHESALLTPEEVRVAIGREETLAGAAEWPAIPFGRGAPKPLELVMAEPPVETPPRDIAPMVGLGLLGLVLFLGGLAWSGAAKDAAGPFNPWVVGTLACLGGVGFMAVAVYFLLLRLGRIPRPPERQ